MKYVVFMSLWPRTIKILISNLPRTRKFSQLFKNTDGEDLFSPWSRVGYALQLLSRVFCYSWIVCLSGFWLRNASLVKVDNPVSGGIAFFFHVRKFELSHSNSVNRITKITHVPNLHVKVLDFFPFTIRT